MTAPTVPVIEVRGLWNRFGDTVVHQDLNLTLESGQMLGLVGGSGSGKTTLLQAIVGLLRVWKGEVRLFGEPLNGQGPLAGRALRRRFGMLFQQGALYSALSVFDNVAFPLRELRCLEEDLIRDLVLLKLAMVEMEPRHARLMPSELSGGMIKRVALARALALEPELLILDEPTAGLDPDRSEKFVKLLRQLQSELGFSVIMVTHDLPTLEGLATQVAVLADQKVVAQGTLAQVKRVDHPFIHNFFAREKEDEFSPPHPAG